MRATELKFAASASAGEVSALLVHPPDARALLVFGHGAGAGMRHAFMNAIADRLAAHEVATLRYQFPYMERQQKRPDPQPLLLATVRAAIDTAAAMAPSLPLFAGGKSMGGRMTSLAAAADPLPGVRGLVFFGFPLHPAGKPSVERAAHLSTIEVPMLFLQGTRDALGSLDMLTPVLEGLGTRAELHIVNDADHGFHVPKRAGRTDAEVLDDLAARAAGWMETHV